MGHALRLLPRTPADAPCAAPARAVATSMFKGLVRAAGFAVEPASDAAGPTLVLHDAAAAEILRFVPDDVGTLTDETWTLTALTLDGQPRSAVSGAGAELAFTIDGIARRDRQERGSMVGSSGCNGILATFERSGDRLRFGDLETTGAPCPADLAAQESAVLAVLASDDLELELPPDRLVLTDRASGDGLELTSSAPLEGSTWLLREVAGRGSPEMPVTLRLADGRLAGEGPCGPYEGSYATDGRFIDIDDLRGTDGAGCGARVQQRELLLALDRAVLLDRRPPRLRLLDAAGALVATFTRPPGP
jgi:heat shock protein HslJ